MFGIFAQGAKSDISEIHISHGLYIYPFALQV